MTGKFRKSFIAAVVAACCTATLVAGSPAYAGDSPAATEGESKFVDLGEPIAPPLAAAAANARTPETPIFGPQIDNYAPSDGQDTCDPTEKPGPQYLRALLNETYDDLTPRTGNIIRACNIGDESEHKEGRALDYMLNVNNTRERDIAETVVGWMLATDSHGNNHAIARRLGIQYIIWNRKIWASHRASEGWRNYIGEVPHTDHIHFSFSWPGARKQTTWWTAGTSAKFDSFSGDARADLVVHSGTEVSVRAGGSDGGFDGGRSVSLGWGRYHGMQMPDGLGRLYFADYDGDHYTDMIVHHGTEISVRLNTGNNTFDGGRSVSLGWGRYHGVDVPEGLGRLYFADYNGDGRADMFVHHGTEISVRLGQSGGGFDGGRSVSLGWGRYHGLDVPEGLGRLYFADYNGDDRADMFVHHGTEISVRLGQSGGGFDGGRSVSLGWGRYHGLDVPEGLGRLYFADYNGDGRADMFVHHGTEISVRLAQSSGGFDGGRSVSLGWGRYHGMQIPEGLGRLYLA